MPAKLRKAIIIIYIIALILVIVGIIIYNNRIKYNPKGARGNTTGNLNNNGMFCEYDGKIYFANPYDHNKLYIMNSDCTDVKLLNTDCVSGINVHGNYIYYIRNNHSPETAGMIFKGQLLGIMRCNIDGTKPFSLYDHLAGVINLYGNDLYYQRYSNEDGLTFYKTGIDGKKETRISDASIFPASIYENKLYYVNTNGDHNIRTYNLTTGADTLYYEANAYLVDMQGDYIYYIDLDAKYSLVRVNTQTMEKQVLVDGSMGKCISYNIYGNSLFYHIEGESPALYRMNTDGADNQFIKYGNITNISCTSQYTFFQIFGVDSLYRVPTTGGTNAELISIQ